MVLAKRPDQAKPALVLFRMGLSRRVGMGTAVHFERNTRTYIYIYICVCVCVYVLQMGDTRRALWPFCVADMPSALGLLLPIDGTNSLLDVSQSSRGSFRTLERMR